MEKDKKTLIKVLLPTFVIIFIILLLPTGLQNEKMLKMKYKKVLVIGIDGMDPKIASKLMAEGKLPNFKRLADTGTFVNLNTSYPPHSPVAWTSIATGKNPGKHNIFDFIRRNPMNYMPELSILDNSKGDYEFLIKADPFWRITSSKGIPTTVIRWPLSFPPERIKGNMLSGLGVPDIKGFLSGYTYYTSKNVEKPSKDSNKVIHVTINNGLIETKIYGPRTRREGNIVEIGLPVRIRINNNSIVLTINGKDYNVSVNSWSDWIRVKFKIDTFKSVYGTFKAYLKNINPFELYLTTIQIDPENPVVDISFPAQYSRELASRIGLYYTLGMPEETSGYVDGVLDDKAFLEQIADIEEERDRMFWNEFEKFRKLDKALFAFVYDSSDRLQHVMWEEKILEDNSEDLSLNKSVIEYFIKKDKFIGSVMDELDNNTLLIIVSDHGFTSFERAVSINTWLVKNGFMQLTKNLSQLNENDSGELFKYVDWKKTKAYSLGFNSIYINLKGRESEGIVDESEYDELINEIIEKLENLTDEETGKRPINKAYRRDEIYTGPYVGNAPDIVIGFNPGYRMSWQTAVGGLTRYALFKNTKKWDGDHLVDPKFVPGVLFSNVKINKKSALQLDIAPTILDALNIEIPSEIDGKSLLR